MSSISSTHNLGGFDQRAGAPPRNPGRSPYRYLCPGPASDRNAGLFSDIPGTDTTTREGETVRRLLAFARWLEQQNADDSPESLQFRIRLPAAYTYFGQFVNHDISAPIGGMLVNIETISEAVIIGAEQLPGVAKAWRADTPKGVTDHFWNDHARPLTLDSLYAEGPHPKGGPPAPQVRALYDDAGLCFRTAPVSDGRPLAAAIAKNPRAAQHLTTARDLLRGTEKGKPVALIADRRNDENLLVSQLHLALMLLHNRAIAALVARNLSPADHFAAARQLVTRHYHWCILHDYLPSLLAPGVLARVLADPPAASREVPMEFTTAAFRFGHSMVSATYDYNANFGVEAAVAPHATLLDLFTFTSHGGMAGLAQVPDHWLADWDRLTDPARPGLARAEAIDLHFAGALMGVVPQHQNELASIVARNLVRGFHRRIPFGQALAAHYDETGLKPPQIASVMPRGLLQDPRHPDTGRDGPERMQLLVETPAWLYMLAEARFHHGGERLGPLASRIIAETFVSLLRAAPDSPLNSPWKPADSPLRTPGNAPIATLRDLLLTATAPD